MNHSIKDRPEIPRLEYQPPGSFPLDIEIFTMSNLRSRACQASLLATHRYAFYQLIFVTKGTCRQLIDFKPIKCNAGSFIVIKPGQAHNFGSETAWDGHIVVFKPEFLGASHLGDQELQLDVVLEQIGTHVQMKGPELTCVEEIINKMVKDTEIKAHQREVHALIRHQLAGLLLRLNIFYGRQGAEQIDSSSLARFREFKRLVDQNFRSWHQVNDYGSQMNCSEKSLSRATTEFAGMSAKSFIAARINLEAKRLLGHTDLSVNEIGDSLGFDETTNFIKFFKREVKLTPLEFRKKSIL